jgi:hypothetical protein
MFLGVKLEIVTDKSQEGSQFVHGFTGIGGSLLFDMVFFSLVTPASSRYSPLQIISATFKR